MNNPTDREPMPLVNHGWRVVFAGVGINLALGVLYSWSVISKKIPAAWAWSEANRSMPYSVACLVFALIMVPAGRMQDRVGPRLVATAGGIAVGLGLIFASFTISPIGYVIGFGVLAGIGFGCGYASTTPPAVKWFPAARTGAIAGIVVAGFGLASVYVAPLAAALIDRFGVPRTVFWLGIGFLVVIILLAQFLRPPPLGYVPAGSPPLLSGASTTRHDFSPGEVLATWQFYILWFMYFCGAGAGLMIISKLAKIVDVQAGINLGFILVACLAIGNGGGRVVAGSVSDKIGRRATLVICFVMQAALVLMLSHARTGSFLGTTPALVLLSVLIGASYGANLALFPSLTKDYYGLANFGVNYGLVFTAWGVGGFTLSLIAGSVFDRTHNFTLAYYYSVGLLLVAAALTFLVKPPDSAR